MTATSALRPRPRFDSYQWPGNAGSPAASPTEKGPDSWPWASPIAAPTPSITEGYRICRICIDGLAT